MEPNMNEEERNVKNWKHSADSLKKFYHLSPALLNWGFGNSLMVSVGDINATPAPNADLFQTTTKYLSKIFMAVSFADCSISPQKQSLILLQRIV